MCFFGSLTQEKLLFAVDRCISKSLANIPSSYVLLVSIITEKIFGFIPQNHETMPVSQYP